MANDLQTLRDVRDLLALRARDGTRPGSLAEAMHVIDLMLMEAKSALAAPVDDKSHPRFMAGYDAGLKDGKRCALRDAPAAPQAMQERPESAGDAGAPPADPCPGCIPGGVCKTPTCGRLLTGSAAAPRQLNIDGIAGDVARAIQALDPIAMGGGHAAHLAAIKGLVLDAILAASGDAGNGS